MTRAAFTALVAVIGWQRKRARERQAVHPAPAKALR
jgi:hypothetical protein